MREIELKPKSQVVRLTPWAYQLFTQLRDRLVEEIRLHPERYPAHAGRRLTLSDVLVMLLERGGLVQ